MQKRFRIATRGSALALAQAEVVKAAILGLYPEFEIELLIVKTTGDKKQGLGPNVTRDKRDWIHEIELAVLNGEADLAVHSAKDVPVEIASATAVHSVLKREDYCDVLVLASPHGKTNSIVTLPPNARIGSSSLRRRAQLKRLRRDLELQECRGNVPTRLARLSELDGIILARAGLNRLKSEAGCVIDIPVSEMIPAVNQGILAVQIRRDREEMRGVVEQLGEDLVERCFVAERAVIRALGADCHSAVGVLGHPKSDQGGIELVARVLNRDGTEVVEASAEGSDPLEIGGVVSEILIEKGALKLL